ncbi:MAG: hypothetical protein ABI781_00640 [Burkholderiales bacterium]
MTSCIATIVSANYLAYARVLVESVQQRDPAWAVKVLVVDRATPEIREAVRLSGLDVTFAEELGLPDFEALAFKYELVEFNTALKPTFLKRLFASGCERVAYLDPDIRLFAPLTPVSNALQRHQIVLTPHALAPAMDGLRPSDIDFLRNGAYNLGFIALARGADSAAMLDWWEQRCLSYGFSDLGFGTFVDQKWIDLVPSYFDSVEVLRDRTCNVAYWNLHERRITSAGPAPTVDGAPLSFFHFSGVKADKPGELSRHQTRHRLQPGTPLAALVADYCSELLRLGHANYSRFAYTFGSFDNGTRITRLMRRASCIGAPPATPFAAGGELHRHFEKEGWVTGGAPFKPPVTNTLDFDATAKPVVLANKGVRVLARIIGIERVDALLRYAGFLARESNYARVLLRQPFDFVHRDKR